MLAPRLREDGFSGSGRTFRRVCGGWIQVVNVQGSKWGGAFAINLAVHPLAIPDLRGNAPDPRKVTEELCEFRRRLSESRNDQWWEHNATVEGMNVAMTAAADVYVRFGRPLLEHVGAPDAPMNKVTAHDFARGNFDFAGFGSTKVRMALALARLRKSEGLVQESKAFASYGISNVGRAALLRHDLEELAAQ
jgi:hypothetical protein